MSISTIPITAGAGTNITVDTTGTGDCQVIKLAEGTLGSSNLIPGTVANGLLVNVSAVAGTVAVVNNGAAKLAVDGSGVTQPVSGAVTANAGTNLNTSLLALETGGNLATIAGAVSGGKVQVSAIPTGANVIGGVTQSGTWNVGAVTSITNTVTVAGTVALSGTSPVSGTVTSNQGTAAAAAGAWTVKITDGTNSLALVTASATQCLPTKVIADATAFSLQDKTAFTEGTSMVGVAAGVFNDAFAGSPAAGQASTVRITAQRAFHVNLRTAAGAEIGTSGSPVYIASTGTNLAVSVKDSNGNPVNQTNPLQTQNAPSGGTGGSTQTPWKQHIAYTANTTITAVHTPASGKISYIEGIIITPTGSGPVTICDNADSATTRLYKGTPSTSMAIHIQPSRPIPLAAANNVLQYITGASAVGDIVAWGYDA